ncbi:hypothetical protein [Spiroplasma poulsonii]|nr:hypothetical protein [Spiroplasma poulsonii]
MSKPTTLIILPFGQIYSNLVSLTFFFIRLLAIPFFIKILL